jgi:hypothetical protein
MSKVGYFMMDDTLYQQEIQQYSLDELLDIVDHIDREQFPERFRLVVDEIRQRQATQSADNNTGNIDPVDVDTTHASIHRIPDQEQIEGDEAWTFGRTITFKDLRPIWRIMVAIIVAQLLGGVIGIVLHFHHLTFYNFWYGAAFSAPVGFLIGLYWHMTQRSSSSSLPTTLLGFIGFLVVSIAVFGGVSLPRLLQEMRLLEETQQLNAAAIQRIVLTDEERQKTYVTIENQTEIDAFVDASRDAHGYAPNHDRPTVVWYVRIEGQTPYEYRCYVTTKYPNDVICRFIQSRERRISAYGCFSSTQLRPWFAHYLSFAK